MQNQARPASRAFFFMAGRRRAVHNGLWKRGNKRLPGANENILRNFHKAFNVLPDAVVLYLGERKRFVAPN
jgi:hypothetical protein